jgi:hypothetical protein
MNNFITLFLSTLSHIGVITEDEGKKLNAELQTATLPDDFEAAYRMMADVFEKLEIEKKSYLYNHA